MTMIIIDGDSLVYKAAGAAQHRNHETGEMEYEPLSHALNNAKTLINKILDRLGSKKYKLFLTHPNDPKSFRKLLYPEYKENRKGVSRPYYYYAVREYYERYWSAQVVHGIEADDAVAMEMYKYRFDSLDNLSSAPAILVGVDKDLDQIVGFHYNYDKDITYFITEMEGFKNLFKQIMGGDRADNIPRIKPKWRSKKVFEEIDSSVCLDDVYESVVFECMKLDLKYDEIAWRADLLYLKRFERDTFKLFLDRTFGEDND